MSDFRPPIKKDRSLQKALTNKIVDQYFQDTESSLRAVLRMCIFSVFPVWGKPAFLIECPNQAIAKRLSRKTLLLKEAVRCFADRQVLICYQNSMQKCWQCFDSDTKAWQSWDNYQINPAQAEN